MLTSPTTQMTFCLSNLMITGSCTPYLHNGIMDASEVGGRLGDSATGVLGRNEIGFLVWSNNKEETSELGLGSRLKTPVTPIWVTCVNGSWGVLFNPNRDLMKSYSAENRFQLYYFSNTVEPRVVKEKRETILTIDTRGSCGVLMRKTDEDGEERPPNPVEEAVASKWAGAVVDWQGIQPYL